jgi:hypothetical protein
MGTFIRGWITLYYEQLLGRAKSPKTLFLGHAKSPKKLFLKLS